MNRIETSIIINAPAEQVWDIFTKFSEYPKWSSFIEQVEGDLIEGSTIHVYLKPPGRKKSTKFTPKILLLRPNFEFRWLGKLGGIGLLFTGEHYFKFEEHNGATTVTHGENFKGILVPFLRNMLQDTKSGFENFNLALKEKCEKDI